MSAILALHNRLAALLDRAGETALPTLARITFAGVLLVYYWNSALSKLGSGIGGIVQPSPGAYVQIFPRAMEAAGYDTAQLGWFHWAFVVAGTSAEFILPALILLGLLTRLASLGMIGFVVLQSLTDLYGHGGLANGVLGAWFDRQSDGLILDQRVFWVLGLLVLVFKGAGPLSLDRVLARR